MKTKYGLITIAILLFLVPAVLPAQSCIRKTIPDENDLYTEYYILEENSDSTDCYLYLFEPSHSYMLIVNYHITPEFTQSYFLSRGTYANMNQQVILQDDVNNLSMKAKRNEFDDLIFEQGLDFMKEKIFMFTEKTSQLPGPPYSYHIFSEKIIQTAIEQAKTTAYNERVNGFRYQTKMFSNHIIADLQLDSNQHFSYNFMHYPFMQGKWEQENELVTLTSESGAVFYGSIHPILSDFSVIQLPGFIFEAHNNHLLYKVK
ncbi:MAG: hypothetical protein LBH90_00545 [Tannerella sp.]|jgi:hypothetical protein|nr:hypothetical protein [Tannerella sp.]